MIPHCQEADETCHHKAHDGTHLHRHTQRCQCPVGDTTYHTRHRVDLLVENHGFIVQQHITDHATSTTSDTTHDDCHPERLSESQTLLDTGNREQRQTKGIEDEPRIFQRFHPLTEECHCQQGHRRTYQIYRCCHPEGCRTQHHVADRSAAYCHSHTTHITTEPIELFRCSMSDTGYRKRERSQQLNHQYNQILLHFNLQSSIFNPYTSPPNSSPSADTVSPLRDCAAHARGARSPGRQAYTVAQ